MWPLDRRPDAELLLVGRHSARRFAKLDGQRLTCTAEQPMASTGVRRDDAVAEAIALLYQANMPARATLVFESAWMPVALVDTGGAFLRSAELDALVRHRFSLYHALAQDPVSGWELRIEHRMGERDALAFALPPQLKHSMLGISKQLGINWTAITPALAWGLEHLQPHKAMRSSASWWLWPEQDRTLIARLKGPRVVGLHPGAPTLSGSTAMLKAVASEAVRLGLGTANEPIAAAVWGDVLPSDRRDPNFTWISISAPLRAQGRTTLQSSSIPTTDQA